MLKIVKLFYLLMQFFGVSLFLIVEFFIYIQKFFLFVVFIFSYIQYIKILKFKCIFDLKKFFCFGGCVQVERIERIKNCLNFKFFKTFIIDYYFEVVQKLKFGIYDIDNKIIELSDDDFLGECECIFG